LWSLLRTGPCNVCGIYRNPLYCQPKSLKPFAK